MSYKENNLVDVTWYLIGSTDEYKDLKRDIARVCRDVTIASCIDEICISDIVQTFNNHGYKVVKK